MAKLKSTIDQAVNYARINNVKIYCGEFGVYNLNSLDADRVNWYKQVPAYLSTKLIPWTMWDYQGGFGLFNKGSNETFEYDINRPLAEGMGFTLPPYKEYVFKADTVPFDIYKDFPGEGITAGVPGSGTADLFAAERHQGNFGIYCTDIPQYSNIEFRFKLTKDLSKLVAANYTADFWMKADSPGSSVVLRFLDTKTSDPKDHPWRRDYTINTSVVPFDGQWHLVQIPLKKFTDAGSWDGAWYGPANLFDWKAVDRFQIVAENMALTGKKFWFDDIRINGTPIVSGVEMMENNEFSAIVFPNPVKGNAILQYDLKSSGLVTVSLFNLADKKVAMLVDEPQSQGRHQVSLSAEQLKLTNGIYVCKINSTGKTSAIKIVVNK
jgi:endoglucanase